MFLYVFITGTISHEIIVSGKIKTKYDSKITWFAIIIIMSLPIFFIGMRTNFADTTAHIKSFNMLDRTFSEMIGNMGQSSAPLWELYNCFFKQFISKDANMWLMSLAIISGIGLCKFFYEYSADFSLSMFIFFGSTAYQFMMNGIRQFLAISIVLFFADLKKKRKTFKFIIL